jgi:peptidyl-prolyl cis-trans isomerase C
MKLLREPLIQFIVLGVVLFFVYGVTSDLFSSDTGRRIEITESDIVLLAQTFQGQWQRPPTEQELRSIVEARVREEVLYREALAVGLDTDDLVVRRRMVQKMELLSQDLALLVDPTDQELQAFFQERQDEYLVPPLVSFSHVYFNLDQRGAAAEEDALGVLADLRAAEPQLARAPDRGDRFMLQYDYSLLSPLDVQRQFGSQFAEALSELEPGWHGPIASGYGLHLVHVSRKVESRIPEYDEVREQLVNDFNRMRRDRANEALYEGLVEGYEVTIDDEALRRNVLVR